MARYERRTASKSSANPRTRGGARGSSRDARSSPRGGARGGSRSAPRGRPPARGGARSPRPGPNPRFPDRESRHGSRNRRDFKMTKVICDGCGDRCEVPFMPSNDKPVYCSNCFSKEGEDRSFDSPRGKTAGKSIPKKEIDAINKKLDKIMEALGVE